MVTIPITDFERRVKTTTMSKKPQRKALKPNVPTPPTRPLWIERVPWQILALTLLVLVAYANSLDGALVYDDQLAVKDPLVDSPGFGWSVFNLGQTRPLSFLTFHWSYLAAGSNPASWHWVSMLLHAATAVLLLLIARHHFSSGTAFIAAALYAVHPLQSEAVAYLYQRSTVLATLFALLSFLLFLGDRYALSVVAFALSLLCKEETIALPVFLLSYDVVFRHRRPRVSYYLAMLGVQGLVAGRAFYMMPRVSAHPTVGYSVKGLSAFSFALTEPRVIWSYLRLFVLPVGQNVDHDVALSHGLFSPPSTLPALLCLPALIGLLVWLAWRGNQVAFWALGFFILLAPTSSIVPVQDVMFEHRVYFPLMGLVIAAAGLLGRLPKRLFAPAVGTILIVLLILTIVRNRVWHDEKSLWTDAAEKSPNKPRPLASAGATWLTVDPERALRYFDHAVTLNPQDPNVHDGLGAALLGTGHAVDALRQFDVAIAEGGEKPVYLTNRGMAFEALGRLDQAIDDYRRALQMDPCKEKARAHLIRDLAAQGNKPEALAATQVPAGCQLLPEQVRALEELRDLLR